MNRQKMCSCAGQQWVPKSRLLESRFQYSEKTYILYKLCSVDLLSYAIALLRQSSQPLPKLYIYFLYSSHISFKILPNVYSSESLAVLIA